MNGALHVLRLELTSDGAAFTTRVAELESLALGAGTDDPNLLARAAVALHHAYGALESALARIAKVFGTEPAGANWHRSLLETMAMEVPGIRPAVVSPAALPDLRELLAFRHFFRRAYVTPLDPGRLAAQRDRAVRTKPLVVADFARVDGWLTALAKKTGPA